MQTFARSDLTSTQVVYLIRDAPSIKFSAGLELLDITLTVLDDLTANFEGGSVSRDSYSTLHGTGTFSLTQDLNWGTAIVRPYMNITDGIITARFNLGAYLTSSPVSTAGFTPRSHSIDGFDILHWLNTPVGESYTAAAGTSYLAAAEQILQLQGITAYLIDQTQASQVLAAPRVWVLDANTTWLNIVNDLLAGVGYMGLWSDWDGNLRMTPYENPTSRAPEFLYTSDVDTSMLGLQRSVTRDFFNVPNRWVFFWAQDPSGAPPVEGAGIYTYVNERYGQTSVDARNRVITAPPQQLDVVDQTTLVNLAQLKIDADLRLSTVFDIPTAPNPLHWHFDRVAVNDPDLGSLADVLVTKWSLPLSGADMTQSWSLL